MGAFHVEARAESEGNVDGGGPNPKPESSRVPGPFGSMRIWLLKSPGKGVLTGSSHATWTSSYVVINLLVLVILGRNGSLKLKWSPRSPAMAAGSTDHIWTFQKCRKYALSNDKIEIIKYSSYT
jgi:hypothetical protein